MKHFINLKQLDTKQTDQYREALATAFPPVIRASEVIENYWSRLEKYFPEFQLFLIGEDGNLIGFMNTVPFHFEAPLAELPDDGWDWMFMKGISDFEYEQPANYLGGLQIIVRPVYQRMGYSRQILDYAKANVKRFGMQQVIIPIRPTKKHLYPDIPMPDYLKMRDGEETYDPWIRTHLRGGARIIKVCNTSMSVEGPLQFWEKLFDRPVTQSGEYTLEGALRPVLVDVEKGLGIYEEPNVWIEYD